MSIRRAPDGQVIDGFRILIVEDDAIIGSLLAEMLTEMGHRVCGVETTEAGAVEAAAFWRPDLMIVDAELAEGSGFQAIKTILGQGRMPHIIMSGSVMGLAPDRGSVLRKPFGESELTEAIQRATGSTDAIAQPSVK
jgi:CheY-like chemotaxis protein